MIRILALALLAVAAVAYIGGINGDVARSLLLPLHERGRLT